MSLTTAVSFASASTALVQVAPACQVTDTGIEPDVFDQGPQVAQRRLGPPFATLALDAQLAAVQSMVFDQLEHVLSLRVCVGHDRARHWKGELDRLAKRGVLKLEVDWFRAISAPVLLVVHECEASGLYCCWNTSCSAGR